MTIKCSCVLAGHGRPITSESSVTPLFIQQPYARESAFAIVYGCFSRIKKMLCRTDMRTRDRMYCQTIRSVCHLPRRSSKNCDLQSANVDGQTDRFKANYSIDNHDIVCEQHECKEVMNPSKIHAEPANQNSFANQ